MIKRKASDLMMMKFTPRPEYAGIAGVLNYGGGNVFNIQEGLDNEQGAIYTDKPLLQHVLSEYQGANGPVFDVATVQDGEETPVVRETSEPAQVEDSDPAQHGSSEGYDLLPIEELRQVAIGSGLDPRPGATKRQLIQLIEQNDAALAAGSEA